MPTSVSLRVNMEVVEPKEAGEEMVNTVLGLPEELGGLLLSPP